MSAQAEVVLLWCWCAKGRRRLASCSRHQPRWPLTSDHPPLESLPSAASHPFPKAKALLFTQKQMDSAHKCQLTKMPLKLSLVLVMYLNYSYQMSPLFKTVTLFSVRLHYWSGLKYLLQPLVMPNLLKQHLIACGVLLNFFFCGKFVYLISRGFWSPELGWIVQAVMNSREEGGRRGGRGRGVAVSKGTCPKTLPEIKPIMVVYLFTWIVYYYNRCKWCLWRALKSR